MTKSINKRVPGSNPALTPAFIRFGAFALIVLCLYGVISRLWACEDAYITFRYIENWLGGYGLVYNIGERVEGFTHPLWLFLIAIPTFLGLAVRASALWLSLVLTLAAVSLAAFADQDHRGRRLILPLALVIFVTNSGWRDFSVSGLEFPLVCLLLVVFYISYKRHGLLGKRSLHGALLALLYLTRPELVILGLSFYLIEFVRGIGLIVKKRKGQFRYWCGDIIGLSLPILILAGGYHLFRWFYYGELFPNTYYAKAGLGTYWSQGWAYFEHFWRYSPVLAAAILLALVLLISSAAWREAWRSNERRLVMLAQALLLMFYVTRLGGDFMAFRFYLPSLVLFALTINDLPNYLIRSKLVAQLGVALLLVATALLAFLPIRAPLRVVHIADERQYYDLWHPAYRALFEEPSAHLWYEKGQILRRLQEDTNYPLVVATGNIGYLGYAAGPRVHIVDAYGLVDYDVARNWQIRTTGERGRPGHEVKLSLELAIAKHVTIWTTTFADWNEVMDTQIGTLITIDPEFMKYFPEKVARLKELKAYHLEHSAPNSDILFFIGLLEGEYGISIEDLPDEAGGKI
ncbi:MAG: hypothetical protein ABIJ61_01845 [bacterium]